MCKPALYVLPLVLLVALTAACGPESTPTDERTTPTDERTTPAGSASKQDAVKSAILRLFKLANENDYAAAAPLIVYRGEDKQRKWKDICDYSQESDRSRVEQVLQKVKRYAADGEPEFLAFPSEKESEGVWLVWEVRAKSREVAFAFLDINGTVALGDID